MANCDVGIVNNNGVVTFTNDNAAAMTVTVTTSPVPSWSPFTIPANSSAMQTFTHPGGTDTYCWSVSTQCVDGPFLCVDPPNTDALSACPVIIPDAAQEIVITPDAEGGTAPYTCQTVVTLPEQGGRTITIPGCNQITLDRVDNIIPPDETVIITVTVTDANGATDSKTMTYNP